MINFIDEVDNHMLIYGLVISHLIVHSCLMNQLQTKDQLLILNGPLYNFLTMMFIVLTIDVDDH